MESTVILGAGAAGLFCAARAGPGAIVIDHAERPAEKVRISGGGRCNFTNLHTRPEAFLSANPHFAKSALSAFSPRDFLDLVEARGIPWHEKALGQLFCDRSSRDVVEMLVDDARVGGADVRLGTQVVEVGHDGAAFVIETEAEGRRRTLRSRSLVVATGGKSIPKMGATGLGYRIAETFGLALTETRAGLVPFAFGDRFASLAGVAAPVRATAGRMAFEEAALFTHRGLSGPAMLQVSSYWREGEDIAVALAPGTDWAAAFRDGRAASPKAHPKGVLARHVPARLADHMAGELGLPDRLAAMGDARIDAAARALSDWRLRPAGTEGYRTAEVTVGGVDTDGLSSKTMEARRVPGLYLIGEVVDVTGWLGGYNFQWAWASAAAAARAIRARSD